MRVVLDDKVKGGSSAWGVMSEPLVHEEGRWRWEHELVETDEHASPLEAVHAGVHALRDAVQGGRASPADARDVAMDARFALGAQEHHLGGVDADAFEVLESFEAEMVDREEA